MQKTVERGLFNGSFVMSLLLFFIPIIIIFFSLIGAEVSYFSIKDIFKYLILLLVLIFVLYYSNRINSSTGAYAFILPISLILQRSIFDLGKLFGIESQLFGRYSIFMYEVYFYLVFLLIILLDSNIFKNTVIEIQYYLFLMLLSLISIIWCYDKIIGMLYLSTALMLPLSYYIFNYLFNNEININHFIKGIILLSILQLFFTWPEVFGFDVISNFFGTDPIQASDEYLRVGGVSSKSRLASLLSFTIPLIFSFAFFTKHRNNKDKIIFIFITLALLSTLALTRHRTHVAVTLFGLTVLLFWGIKNKLVNIKYSQFLGLVSFGFFFMLFFFTFGVEDAEKLFIRDTLTNRLLSYYVAIMNVYYSYGLGVGSDNFIVTPLTSKLLGLDSWFLMGGHTVHNDYLKILSELGIVGLVIFIIFISKIFKKPFALGESYPIEIGIKTSVLIISIISITNLTFSQGHILILLGAYIAIMNHRTEISKNTYNIHYSLFTAIK